MSGGYFSSIFASSCGVFSSPPVISGSATEGTTLTGTDATGYGTVTSRKWQRSYDNVTWLDIPSATSSTYVLKYEDVGNYVRFTNVADSTVSSTALGTVTAISVPGTTPASPATRDVTDVTIESGGWSALVTVKGWAGSAGSITYSYGDEAADTSKFRVKVFSEGYDTAGNLKVIERTVYGTATIRKPYPNHANKDETTSGSDEVIRVALSENIYADDNTGAGKSGRAPIVTVDAGWATYGGNGTTATYLTCTNNSTNAYPKPVAKWDEYAGVVTKERVQSTFTMAVNAHHRLGVRCVRFDATGGTSSANVNAYVTSLTKTQRTRTGLYGSAYQTTVPLTSFTQGETLNLRARVYPVIGDATAVLDSDDYTASTDECLGFNKPTLICDKNASLDVSKYVATTGNDTTGDGSSGNPYLTIAKAAGVGANIVYLKAGTHAAVGGTPASPVSTEWVVVKPAPGESYSTVTVQMQAMNRATGISRLKYEGVTINETGTTSYVDGSNLNRHLWVDDCTLDKGAVGNSGNTFYRFDTLRMTSCKLNDRTAKWAISEFSTSAFSLLADGTDFGSYSGATSESIKGVYQSTCCYFGNCNPTPPTTSNALPDPENMNWLWNKVMNVVQAVPVFKIGDNGSYGFSIARGIAVVGNLFEYNGSVQPCVQMWADATNSTSNNVIYWHNTAVGERSNLAYNDVNNIAHTNWSVKFNYCHNANIKSDVFATLGANVGNWPALYGVGWEGNRANATAGFSWEYGGRDCPAAKWPIAGGGTTGLATPNFTSDKSAAGDDAGNGNYLPTAGSDLLDVVPVGREVMDYDLLGRDGRNAGAILAAS